MAKESMKAREVKRAKLVAKYAAKRQALKEAGDWAALDKLPKNSAASLRACLLAAYLATNFARFTSRAFIDSLAILFSFN